MTEPALGPELLGVVRRKRHCKLCDFSTTNSAEFVKHQQKEHNGNIHVCRVCQLECPTEEELVKHKREHIEGTHLEEEKMAHSPSKNGMDTEDNNNAMKSLMPTIKNNNLKTIETNNIDELKQQNGKQINGFIHHSHGNLEVNGFKPDQDKDASSTKEPNSTDQDDQDVYKDLSDDDDNIELVIDEDVDTSEPQSQRKGSIDNSTPTSPEVDKVAKIPTVPEVNDKFVQMQSPYSNESKVKIPYPPARKMEPTVPELQSNAIDKMRSLYGMGIPSLASENPSISQHLKHIVIEPQPMDDIPTLTVTGRNTSALSSSSNHATPVSTPPKRCAPVREAVDPAKYITVQEGDGIKYACSKCGNIYKWRKSLNKHWKEKHDGEIPEPRISGSSAMPNIPLPRISPASFRPSPVNSNSRVVPQVSSPRNIPQISPRDAPYGSSLASHIPHDNKIRSRYDGNLFSPKMSSIHPSQKYTTSTPKQHNSSLSSPPGVGTSPRNLKSPMDPFANSAVMQYLKSTQQHSPIKVSPKHPVGKAVHKSPPAAHSNKPIPRYIPPRPIPLDAPIDLTRDLPIIVPPKHEPEGILDLSKKQAFSQKNVFFDAPPQDEPLDFSNTSSKTKDNSIISPEKNTDVSSFQSWNLPVKIDHEPLRESPFKEYEPASEHVGKPIHCHVCTYVTRDQEDMDLHMQLHSSTNEQQFFCAECQGTYSSLEALNQHFAVDHMTAISKHMSDLRKEQSYENQLNSGPQLYRYLTMDPSKNAKSCLVCGALYQWQWALAKHFEQDHSTLPNPYQLAVEENEDVPKEDPGKVERQLKCSQCSFTASNISDLTRHQIRHSLNKHHICRVCGYTARTKEELGDHYSEDHPSVDPTELKSTTGTVILHGTYGDDSNHSSGENTGLLGPDGKPLLDLSGENIAIVIPQAPEDSNGNGTNSNRSKAGRKPNTSGPSSVDVLLPYKCTACEYRARWPSEITQHMKNHSDEKPFLCPRCTYRSKWKWDVVKHLKRCGGGTVKDVIDTTRLKKNQHANPLAGRPESIAYTQGRELSNGPPNVTVVPGGSVDNNLYNNSSDNQSNHSTDDDKQSSDPLECAKCSFIASSSSELKRHVKFHSYDVNQVYCTQCPFVGNNPAELKRHLRVHSDEKPFICKTCGYSSKWKCDLKKHCNTYHHIPASPLTYSGHGRKPNIRHDDMAENVLSDEQGESYEEGEASDGSSEYRCTRCPFVTNTHGVYQTHMKKHASMGKSYNCKQCNFESDDLSSYLQHNLIHNSGSTEAIDEQVNDSDIISDNGDADPDSKEQGSSNRRKQSKQTIMKAVLNEDEANMSEDNVSNFEELQSRSNDHHASFNGKVYACTYCPYSTHNKANYERHMPHHETLSKYQCEWCNWSSDRLNLLYRHAQVIHTEQVSQHEKEAFYDKVKDRYNYFNEGSASLNYVPFPESTNDLNSDLVGTPKNGSLFSEGKKTKRRLKTCGKCGYITDNVTTLQRHMAKHGKLGKYTCTHCDYSVDKQHVLDYHTRLVHAKEMPNPALLTDAFECDNTSNSTVEFNDDASVGNGSINSDNVDEPIEDDNNTVNLESADISTVQGEDVKIVHVGTRTVYGCTKCPYHTMKISGVLNHSRQHGQMKRFTCSYCDYSVDQSAHVKNHMKTVHGHNIHSVNPVDLAKSKYNYEDMDSTDIASNGNDSEMQEDENEYEPQSKRICLDNSAKKMQPNMYRCSKCAHVTFDKIEWLKHKLVHMDEPRPAVVKSHLCDRCPYRTGNRSQLEAHKTRHGVPSKYDCPYCDYSCGNATQQGNHVKLHFPNNQDMDKSVLHLLIKGEVVEGYEPVVTSHEAPVMEHVSEENDINEEYYDSSVQDHSFTVNSVKAMDINCNTDLSANV